jgi:NAD+ kinase
MARILLVTKTPLLRRLRQDDHARLLQARALVPDQLEGPAHRHDACLAAVRTALARHTVREIRVEDLVPRDAAGIDLVVTVGGDGTVFTANTLATDAPFLTVNSDPASSIGHFARATVAQVPDLLAAWSAGRVPIESVPRLRLKTATGTWYILNDCLFTSTNPAAMTRALLECPEGREIHRSSGLWIATAAGSTGAIHSAGCRPVGREGPALLWQVREAFLMRDGEEAPRFLTGLQEPPRWLKLTPVIPGIACYLDGPNITIPLAPGQVVEFSGDAPPLRLLRPA